MATKSDKVWADAVRKAVHDLGEQKDEKGVVKKVRYINILASQLVKSAADGDMTAMKEIGDRLDGKPHQSTDTKISGELGISKIERHIVRPKNTDG